MDIVTYFPQNKLLQPFIDRYYFLKTTDEDFSSRYYVFPSMITPLNIHKNIVVGLDEHHTVVSGSKEKNYQLILQGMRKKPLAIELRGMLDKITILFKPLGLNHFIKNPFGRIAAESSQLFTEWDEQEIFHSFLHSFYSTDDNDQRIIILEEFLLSMFAPVKNYSVFSKAVQQLTDFNEEKSVSDIVTFFKALTLQQLLSPMEFPTLFRIPYPDYC